MQLRDFDIPFPVHHHSSIVVSFVPLEFLPEVHTLLLVFGMGGASWCAMAHVGIGDGMEGVDGLDG